MQTARGLDQRMASEQLKARPDAPNELGVRLEHVHSFKILGYWNNRAPLVDLLVEGPNQNANVTFKVDTAAQRTIISPKDARSLGLYDYVPSPNGNAPDGSTPLLAFSGKESAVGMPANCTFWFKADVPAGSDYVMLGVTVEVLMVETEDEWPDSMRSLLGQDLLEHFELTVCPSKDEVILRSNGPTSKVFGYALPESTLGNGSDSS